MFRYFLFLPFLMVGTGVTISGQNNAQKNVARQGIHCCGKNSTETFAALASLPAFVHAHAQPPVYHYRSEEGKDIHFLASDGKEAHAFAFRPAIASKKYLFVIHDFFGLGDFAKGESLKLFHDLHDVNVIALDLYDNKKTNSRDTAAKLMQAVKTERALAIIRGAIQYAGKGAKIATIGWCFGGGWSLQAALEAKKETIGCVIYYGMPEKNVEKLKTLNCDVLGIYAKKDQWITPQIVSAFQKDMQAAGKKMAVYSYDAAHGFANPTTPGDNTAPTQDAYKHTLAYLSAKFE